MKNRFFSFLAVAAASFLIGACIDPSFSSKGVSLVALNQAFESKQAEIQLVFEVAPTEPVKVVLAVDESSTVPDDALEFDREITVPMGATTRNIAVSLKTKNLENGEYVAVIKIVSAENSKIGNPSSVSIAAVVDKKDDSAWTPLPTFNKVSTFPTIIITTQGGQMPQRVSKEFIYVPGTVVFKDPDGMYSDVPELECSMQIRGRGNTTWNNAKKAYKIKLDEKNKVFGMKGDSDWAILAEWSDGTLLRNQAAMQISRIVGMSWTPRCCSAEVTFNGQSLGLYTFIEHKEVGDSKIAMGEDGFYLDLDDKEEDNDQRFTTPNYYKVIKFKDPDSPTLEQRNYVKNFFTNMENTLASNTNSTFLKYREMMDVDSFIRNFIVQELTKNVDGNLRLSTPLVLENDVLRCPMVWDFDLSLGNGEMDGYFPLLDVVSGTGTGIRNTKAGDGPTGWFVRVAGGRPYGWENPNKQTAWYQRMWNDPEFVSRLKEIWNEVYPNLQTVPGYIDALYDMYSPAIQREWDVWSYQNRSNRSGARLTTPKKQYDAMRKFYVDRLAWLNTAINKL